MESDQIDNSIGSRFQYFDGSRLTQLSQFPGFFFRYFGKKERKRVATWRVGALATRGDCEGTSRAAIEPALRQEHSVPNADPGDPRSIVRRSTPVAPKPLGHPRTFVTRNRRARGGLAESDPTAPPCTQVRSRECIVRKSPRRIHRLAPSLDRASNQPRDGRPHRRGALPGTLAPGVGFPFFGKSTFRREKKFPRFTPTAGD